MSLALVKKGDKVMVLSPHRGALCATVDSAGPAWITVARSRYHRCDGRIENGTGTWRIKSIAEYDAESRYAAARRSLEVLGLKVIGDMPLDKVEAVLAAARSVLDAPSEPSGDKQETK